MAMNAEEARRFEALTEHVARLERRVEKLEGADETDPICQGYCTTRESECAAFARTRGHCCSRCTHF